MRKLSFLFLKHIVYPRLFRRRSRLWVLLQTIYWAATLTCNFIFTPSLGIIGARAGNMAIANLIPLLLAGRLHLAADLLGIPIRSYLQFHGTFGAMTMVQAAIHSAISIRERGWDPQEPVQFYGLLAVSAISLSAVLLLIRKWIYELFLKSHYWIAVLILIALWRHAYLQRAFARLYLIIGSSAFGLSTLLHWMLLFYRNITSARFGSRACVRRKHAGAAELVIPVNRPFVARAGMTIYIWMPGVSPLSILQSHPFTITWWETDDEGRAKSLSLLIQKRNGFTRRLLDHSATEFLAWIDGPYNKSLNLGQYQRVLMVASGNGIVAQIPYIRELLDLDPDVERTIFVAWEVDDAAQLDWVYPWMDELLAKDKGNYILRFGLYMPGEVTDNSPPQPWNSQHQRIWKLHGLSAHDTIRQDIRKVVQSEMEDIVDFVELPFQPAGDRKVRKLQKSPPSSNV
ncbi:hypothetical protein BJX96DRAFT_183665 [Aspergillus floccosus]